MLQQFYHAVHKLIHALHLIDRIAEFGRTRKPGRIPCDVLSHLTDRDIFSFIFLHQTCVLQDRITDFSGAHRFRFHSVFQIFFNAVKNPRIALGCPSDHNAVAAGLIHHGFGAFPIHNVTIADDRNGNSFFDLPDNIPVGFSTVILFSRPAMTTAARSDSFCLEKL